MGYFSRLGNASELVSGMADRLGRQLIDLDKVPAEQEVRRFRNMIFRCAACEKQDECISLQSAHHRLAQAPEYCRNKSELEHA